MDAVNRFNLEQDTQETSLLFNNGSPTKLSLPGVVLEGQWQLQNGWYLLCSSENSPFEEAFHFTLLDENIRFVESVELSAPYTPGIVSSFESPQNNQLTFSINNNEHFTLHVLLDGTPLLKKLGGKGKRKNIVRKSYLYIVDERTYIN